jgi:hypothetical protein
MLLLLPDPVRRIHCFSLFNTDSTNRRNFIPQSILHRQVPSLRSTRMAVDLDSGHYCSLEVQWFAACWGIEGNEKK